VLDGGERHDGRALFWREAPAEQRERWFPRGVRDGFALELLEFLQAIGQGRAMETSAEEGVRDLACSYAVLESATVGRPVKVAEVLNGTVDAYQRAINQHYGL